MPLTGQGGHFWYQGRHGIGVDKYLDLRKIKGNLPSGMWAVLAEFDGPWHAWRMRSHHICENSYTCAISPAESEGLDRFYSWKVPAKERWSSSLSRAAYQHRVNQLKTRISRGEIEQMNLCRILSTPADTPPPAGAVHAVLNASHPAPYSGWFEFALPHGSPLWLVSASPELSFSVEGGILRFSPIKGTAPTASQLLEKDYVENRLVTQALIDRLAAAGYRAEVVSDCHVEEHPGLVQLVSTVEVKVGSKGQTEQIFSLLSLLHPPLSVAGVPYPEALDAISELEPVGRGPYCGSFGWFDTDSQQIHLGVVIRSFWWSQHRLNFGTGAGITSGSDAETEWKETELKAARLIDLLSSKAGSNE